MRMTNSSMKILRTTNYIEFAERKTRCVFPGKNEGKVVEMSEGKGLERWE